MTPSSGASSPTPEPPEFVSRPNDLSDDEGDDHAQQRSGQIPSKRGGYDSRIEQILYEYPDLQIVITDAGKSHESGSSYIAYTIRTGVCYSLSRRSVPVPRELMLRRTWKSGDDTRSFTRCEQPWSTYIQLSSSLQSPKSIQWPTMLPSRPKQKKTLPSLNFVNACSPCF